MSDPAGMSEPPTGDPWIDAYLKFRAAVLGGQVETLTEVEAFALELRRGLPGTAPSVAGGDIHHGRHRDHFHRVLQPGIAGPDGRPMEAGFRERARHPRRVFTHNDRRRNLMVDKNSLYARDLTQLQWSKSSWSHDDDPPDNCVEVASFSDGVRAVRDSKRPDLGALMFTAAEWSAFAAGVRAGEFGA